MENIAKAINAVMTEVNGVSKDMTVGKGGNSYKGVGDANVRIVIRESMIKNGLCILPTGVTPTIKVDRWEEEAQHYNSKDKYMKSKQSIFTDVTTTYILLHTSGESQPIAGYGQGVDTQDKGAGKATTYALKNTLLNLFLVPTGVDTDDTHSEDLPVPQDKGLDFEDHIFLMKEEKDINHLATLWKEFQKGNWSEEQVKMATDVKEQQKITLTK